MEALALKAYEQVGANPELTTLFGKIYLEQAAIAKVNKKYALALVLCNRALAYGQNP